jgi:hypothetical protein
MVTICTTSLTSFELCFDMWIYIFYMDLRKNSDYFPNGIDQLVFWIEKQRVTVRYEINFTYLFHDIRGTYLRDRYKYKQEKQPTYNVNIDECSRNNCCLGKAINMSYSECVSVVLLPSIQVASAVLYCHLRPVWLYHIFPIYLTMGMIFDKKNGY